MRVSSTERTRELSRCINEVWLELRTNTGASTAFRLTGLSMRDEPGAFRTGSEHNDKPLMKDPDLLQTAPASRLGRAYAVMVHWLQLVRTYVAVRLRYAWS